MHLPCLSVIIPTYNRAALLPRAIDSILAQSEQDFEILVVDDASTDDTEELVRTRYGLDARVRYVRLAENGGVDRARNVGLDHARGAAITFLDSDDEFLPGAFSRALAVPIEYGLVMAPYRLSNGELTGFAWPEGDVPFTRLLCEQDARPYKPGFALVRKEAVGDLRWETKYLQALWYHYLGAKTRVYYLTEPLGIYHFDKSDAQSVTNTRRKANARLSVERARVLARFLDYFGDSLIEHCPFRYGFYAYGAAVGLLLDGQIHKARSLMRAAMRHSPRRRYQLLYGASFIPLVPSLLSVAFWAKRRLQSR